MPESQNLEPALPDYTLRKKYTKRPANVIKIRLKKPEKELKLPEDSVHRIWMISEHVLVTVKTWRFSPLPRINECFKNIEIENITIEFNLGPHAHDGPILEEISNLKASHYCLEFREHWSGLFPRSEETVAEESVLETDSKELLLRLADKDCYSDEYLAPFLKQVSENIRIITGRISIPLLQKICICKNLQFLGLRVNYDEYRVLTDCIEEYSSLERIHILPQWKHDSKLSIPPIRFKGVVTIYYWDLETTQAVNKALKKWKRAQSRSKFFCWFK